MTITLPRIEQKPSSTQATSLAEEARCLLGYNQLKTAESAVIDEVKLFEACVAAGVRPFQTTAVERYKKEKTKSFSRLIIAAEIFLIALTAVTLLIMLPHPANMVLSGVPIMLAPIIIGATIAIHTDFYEKSWHAIPLHSFIEPVPFPLLQMAIQIKKLCPEVDFKVHKMMRDPDPFLSAHLGDAMFYIAVWDEPSFNAKFE